MFLSAVLSSNCFIKFVVCVGFILADLNSLCRKCEHNFSNKSWGILYIPERFCRGDKLSSYTKNALFVYLRKV